MWPPGTRRGEATVPEAEPLLLRERAGLGAGEPPPRSARAPRRQLMSLSASRRLNSPLNSPTRRALSRPFHRLAKRGPGVLSHIQALRPGSKQERALPLPPTPRPQSWRWLGEGAGSPALPSVPPPSSRLWLTPDAPSLVTTKHHSPRSIRHDPHALVRVRSLLPGRRSRALPSACWRGN